jgi:hypothetical protein
MWQRISTKQRIVCGSIGVITALVYLGVCVFSIGAAWQRNEGDIPRTSPWIEHATDVLIAFPFGYVPGLRSIVIAPICNAILWGIIAGAIYIRITRTRAP